VQFLNVAGNDEILLTAVAPRELKERLPAGQILSSLPMLTQPPARRLAVRVPLERLTDLIVWLRDRGVTVEHVYDY
jgi:hypothetical protein